MYLLSTNIGIWSFIIQCVKNPQHTLTHLIHYQASIETQFLKEDSRAIHIKTNKYEKAVAHNMISLGFTQVSPTYICDGILADC